MKKNCIIWEAGDRSGKDTFRVMTDKHNDYRYVNIVRGPIGYTVYNRLYHKGQDEEAFKASAKALDEFAITIYLKCDLEVLAERMRLTNEVLRGGDDLARHKAMYDYVINEAREEWGLKNVYTIENNGAIEQTFKCIKDLLDFIQTEDRSTQPVPHTS